MQKEFLRKISDLPLTVCPECGKETLQKMVTAAGFQLKGTGWYATDFKGSGKPAAAKSDSASAGSGGDAKTEIKADTKSDSKSESNTDAKTESKTETKTEPATPAA